MVLTTPQTNPLFKIDKFSKDELIYRGEGNSSLVVAIKSTGQVIRLLKSDAKKLRNAHDVFTHQLQHIDFNEKILPDVIPEHLFSSPRLICLDAQQIDLIRTFVQDKRPPFRLDKTFSNCGYALLMTDYCTIPTRSIQYDWTSNSVIAVEIKPKQGFLPSVDLFCSDDDLKLKSRNCRFGLSQFYKLQKQSIKEISSYCPLDLFSGCPTKTLYSLLCLIENPQNNFRVFLNSHLIYDDKTNIEHFLMILEDFFGIKRFDSIQKRIHGKTNGGNNYYKTMKDSVTSFGLLLLQILMKPLDDNKENQLERKILKKQNHVDNDNVPNIKKEMKNLKTNEKYVFFRTFLQIFEKLSTNNQDTMMQDNVCHGNDSNDLISKTLNFQNNDNRLKETCLNANLQNYKTKLVKILMKSPIRERSGCWLHQTKRLKMFNSNLDFDCGCSDSDSVKHRLPDGCVLDSILQAQKLDKIDSKIAMDIFNQLFRKYKELKQNLGVDCLYPLKNDQNGEKNGTEEKLETFIQKNFNELDTLWRFLLSLTAKDCSIMIAMQRFDSDGNENHSFPRTSKINGNDINEIGICDPQTPLLIDVIDKKTGHQYMAGVSIIDLDSKTACKIQRMLHNDRRMINAFLNSFNFNSTMKKSIIQSKFIQ